MPVQIESNGHIHGGEVDIFSLNAWQIAEPLTLDGDKRFDLLFEYLHREEPDIIFLQEIWRRRDIVRLVTELGNQYNIGVRPNFLFNRGGLVILSRTELSNVTREKYDIPFQILKPYIVERVAGKGYMYADTEMASHTVRLINTHLHEVPTLQNGGLHKEIAVAELSEVLQFGMQSDLSIIAGDFNLGPDILTHVIEEVGGNYAFLSDGYTINKATNPYQKTGMNLLRYDKQKRIDFVLVGGRCQELISVVRESVVVDLIASDHYGLQAQVQVTPEDVLEQVNVLSREG